MRGPGYRHDLDVRRIWHCPQCGKQRRLAGDVTSVTCVCGTAMQLVEPLRRGSYEPQPLVSRELTVASFALTEEELARPVVQRVRPAPEAEAPAEGHPSQRGGRKPRRGPPPRQDRPLPADPPAASDLPQPSEEGGFGEGLVGPEPGT